MTDLEEVEDLKQRDIVEYRNPDGPTFEFLVQEWRARLDLRATRFMWPSLKGRVAQTEAQTRNLGFEVGG